MDRIQMQPPVEKYANPNTCLFNVLFKARALAFYILSALFFNSFVIIFVVTVFLAALDFLWWTIYLTTKRTMESSIPYVVLGVLYAYLQYLSWSPDTLRSMFVSKYWLPKLPGIRRMFPNKMTVASAWIHLLAVDLFARCCCEWENSKDDIFEMIIQFTF